MTGAADALTIHQLLGRIVYFHALFIAPEQRNGALLQPGLVCCNHSANPGRRSVGEVLADSAWNSLAEVATALPAQHRPCPNPSEACCATCNIIAAAAAVASGWALTEHRTYRQCGPAAQLVEDCGNAAADRLGRVFAAQHACPCPALDRLTTAPPAPRALPSAEELPLTGELLVLWADPAATTHRPLASWLNHCTGLGDVRRVLDSRRSIT